MFRSWRVDFWDPTLAWTQILALQAGLISPWAWQGLGSIMLPAAALHPNSEELRAWVQVKVLCPHLIVEDTLLAFLLSTTVNCEHWSPVHQGLLS